MNAAATLSDLVPQLNEAAALAASKAGTTAAQLVGFQRHEAYHDKLGVQTTCQRTAKWAATWLNARKVGRTDYGRLMTVHVYPNANGAFDVVTAIYAIGD